jgi:hypothetical protein
MYFSSCNGVVIGINEDLSTIYMFIIYITERNNSPCIDISLISDTLFWFRAKQSLLLLLNAACLAEKQHIPIYSPWFDPTGARTHELPHSRRAR